MQIIPIIKCRDLPRSLSFYTEVLDFELIDPADTTPVRELRNGNAELHISSVSGDSVFGIAIDVHVDDVDAQFRKYVARGLDPSQRPESPVHQAPIDQTWGWRELYVTDPDGNTLRFRTPIR